MIQIVMTDFIRGDQSVGRGLTRLKQRILEELSDLYPGVHYDPEDFSYSLNHFYEKSGYAFVVIIDEWDAVFRVRKEDKEGQTEYLNFLRDWLKDRAYISLAYMTGILPIKKYGEHSALNMFEEYSMTAPKQFAPYTGFTEEEVKSLCERYEMSYQAISDWYDGYLVSDRIPVGKRKLYYAGEYQEHQFSIYSPLSVVNALRSGLIMNYWNNTESYEALAEYIRRDYDGLKNTVALLMDGGRMKVDTSGYQNDMTTFHGKDDILTLLIHLGYLGYDLDTGEVFIPNKEVLDVFQTSTRSDEWSGTFHAFSLSQKLLQAVWALDEKKTAELLEQFHDDAANQTYHDEAALSYSIQLAFYAAQKYYTKILEMDTGKGYADLVYIPAPKYPDKPVLLIELKVNQTAETALEQIRNRNYPERLRHYKGNILLVAISYQKMNSRNPDFKHHTCKIEKA